MEGERTDQPDCTAIFSVPHDLTLTGPTGQPRDTFPLLRQVDMEVGRSENCSPRLEIAVQVANRSVGQGCSQCTRRLPLMHARASSPSEPRHNNLLAATRRLRGAKDCSEVAKNIRTVDYNLCTCRELGPPGCKAH
jgi:hypothetical protein